MVAGVLLPLFGRMLSQQNNVAPIVRLSVNILLPVSCTALAVAAVFGQPIMEMLYTTADADAGLIFGVLMIAFPAYSLSYVYATLLTAAGKLRILNIISAIGVIISLSLNLNILPHYGAFGAAITAAITQGVVAVLNIIAAHRSTDLTAQPRWIGAHLGYAVLLGGAAFLCHTLPGDWRLRTALLGAAGLLLMLPFGFVNLRSVKALLKQ
jgi:O-antigen/teichoic acid export membrane protein